MRRAWVLRFLAFFLLLELLPRPGDGNEGSVAGSCYCGMTISSGSPPTRQFLAHLRKYLKVYHRCNNYIRFQLPARSLCGGSKDQWVQELMTCFDRRECGHVDSGSVASRQRLPPPSTQVPEPTETAPLDLGSPAQSHLPPATPSTQAPMLPAGAPSSHLPLATRATQVPTLPAGAPSSHLPPATRATQAPTLPAGAPSLDEELTHTGDTVASTVGHGVGAGSEAGEKQKRLEDNVGATSGTSATVPVVSLLAITFALTVVLLYFLCQRKKKCLQHSPDLQLHYTAVGSDSNA